MSLLTESWPSVDTGLSQPPDESVWPYLEAAGRAVQKFGWARTTMGDIAREAGVERTTIYRRVGSMPDVFRLMVAHELHKLVRAVPDLVPPDTDGPGVVVEVVAASVEHCRSHPVLTKVIDHEPELVSSLLVDGVPAIIERISELLDPTVASAMDTGFLARRDPTVVTQWIARIGLSLLVAPPPGDLRTFLDAVLRPLLEPTPAPGGAS